MQSHFLFFPQIFLVWILIPEDLLEWVIIAKDLQEFDTIVTEATNKFSEIIMEKHKFGIIYGYESMHYPINLEHASENLVLNEYQTPEIIKLDESDYKIINALVKNSRESVSGKFGNNCDLCPNTVPI